MQGMVGSVERGGKAEGVARARRLARLLVLSTLATPPATRSRAAEAGDAASSRAQLARARRRRPGAGRRAANTARGGAARRRRPRASDLLADLADGDPRLANLLAEARSRLERLEIETAAEQQQQQREEEKRLRQAAKDATVPPTTPSQGREAQHLLEPRGALR